MSNTDRIQQLLAQRPGLKAQQIASELGLDRSHVAAALHDLVGGGVVQDSTYRWWPKTRESRSIAGSAPAPRTLLENLCRYYLDCLARESGSGISIPAASQGAEYVALSELPFARPENDLIASDRAVKRIIRKARQERGQLTLYIGYAICLRALRLRDEEEMRIEPVLLYPIEETPEHTDELLRPVSGIPLFNIEVLKSLLDIE